MIWRHVFDGDKMPTLQNRNLSEVCKMARKAGYRFVAFLGFVYFNVWDAQKGLDAGIWQDTGLRVNNKGEIV